MSYKLQDIEVGEKYFYYLNRQQGNSSIVSFGMQMKEKVRTDILVDAVRKAVHCFPLFKLRPVINENGEIYLIENTLPIEIYAFKDEPKTLGTEEVNGYMFRVSYDRDYIFIMAHHSLGDGRTIASFLITTVYFYLKNQGIEIDSEGKIYTEECLDNPTLMNSFFTDAKKMDIGEGKGGYSPENVFDYVSLEKTENATFCYQITWDNLDMKNRLKELGITPVPFIAAIMEEAFHNLTDVGDQHIVTAIPVDMRGKMKSISQRNYISNIRLPFYPEWRELSFEEKTLKLKECMNVQLETNNILSRVKDLEAIVQKMVDTPLISADRAAASERKKKKTGAIAATYTLSNIGKIAVPKDMEPYIKDFLCVANHEENENIFMMMYTIRDKSSFVVNQPFENDKLIKEVCRLMNEQNIHADLSVYDFYHEDKVDVGRFMRVHDNYEQ